MSAQGIRSLNQHAEITQRGQALMMTVNAAKGLQEVLRSNLGPRGTLKMLVSGAGDIKMTKDGKTLLSEMQIQNPTACLIARSATAQDDICGDGTTTNILFIGELMKQAERFLGEGIHPRILTEGFELAQGKVLEWLEEAKRLQVFDPNTPTQVDREMLTCAARCSLRTKLTPAMADQLTEYIVDACMTVKKEGKPLDLHMVEIMHMEHRLDTDTRLVRGLVMDHGSRHPDMPARSKNCFILTLNVSLEFEKSEVTAQFNWSNSQDREKLVLAEREWVDQKVRKVIELKREVCVGENKDAGFVVVNQKGIDPPSLDMLAKEGIVGLRRAKRRNMERLTLACGGVACNSVDDLTPSVLGRAGNVYEQTLGEEKYTFVEDVVNPFSCTILVKGPNKYTIEQLKDAIRDGLRAVKNTWEDNCVVPGAGAFFLNASHRLSQMALNEVVGRQKLGVVAFAEALLVVPKTLAENSGFDRHDVLVRLQEGAKRGFVGLDIDSGECLDPIAAGIYDNYRVLRQIFHSSPVIASQLLLVDELIQAGHGQKKQ
eukprot:gnl/Spiro4/15784_TR8489_c0_g1_i1.p1 gnl/Spiro4/15784_TR8489_c0_g1~~gnl/Spiro4/15784_TR8489_c0_g1_i1.p1  ORF type:complete len:543 (-),score=154.49 gnl/Spiro4/15784_TR8489_c0_g1_i1:108-1736(-)